jgi:hypothetical protein
MGECDSEGSGDCKDQVEINFHTREKKSDCNCGSEKCDCDGSCPKFDKGKSVLDVCRPYTRREKVRMMIILLCVIVFWAIIYYLSLS